MKGFEEKTTQKQKSKNEEEKKRKIGKKENLIGNTQRK